jgi:hypothetical protein
MSSMKIAFNDPVRMLYDASRTTLAATDTAAVSISDAV